MEFEDNHVLSTDEIKILNTLGAAKLDDSGNSTYIIKFAFNDQKNQATDPIPFRIATDALDKIAKTGIGRPYVFNPGIKNNVGEHVRGPVDDPKRIVEFQKKFAIGMMESTMRNKSSNNVYAIINLFPEYVDDVQSGNIPFPTSPLLEPIDMKGDTIYDANWLHLQAVPASGYPMSLTSKLGMCQGMLDKCATELKTLGSSGKLKNFQKQFSYTESTLGSLKMGNDTPGQVANGPDGTGAMSVDDIVKNHSKMLDDHNKTLGSIQDTLKQHGDTMGSLGNKMDAVLKSVSDKEGDAYPGTDASEGQTTGSEGAVPKPGANAKLQYAQSQKKDFNSLGSAGQQIEQMQKELADLKKEREAEKARWAMKEREDMAKIIVSGEIVLKEITPDKFAERVQEYVNLKDSNKNSVDLSLLANKYKKLSSNIPSVGASGDEEDRFPSLDTVGASGNTTTDKSTLELMKEFS